MECAGGTDDPQTLVQPITGQRLHADRFKAIGGPQDVGELARRRRDLRLYFALVRRVVQLWGLDGLDHRTVVKAEQLGICLADIDPRAPDLIVSGTAMPVRLLRHKRRVLARDGNRNFLASCLERRPREGAVLPWVA